MSKFRKPTIRERISGCFVFLKEILVGIFCFDRDRAKFGWVMFWETAKGNFEVEDTENG